MTTTLHRSAHNLLFRLQPETAHGLAIRALKSGLVVLPHQPRDKRLEVKVAGLALPNPIGIAAGFDKNAEAANPLLKLGFGFAEVGTVTPRPQTGNAKPRLFRLTEDAAIINRLGFNNEGCAAVVERLRKRHRRRGIVGINIGANKDSEDRVADYAAGIKAFAQVADYFTVNVSSPNTPGLRDLQERESLQTLLNAVTTAREAAANISRRRKPIFLKIAPDLSDAGLQDVAEVAAEGGVDGLVISNTTLSRQRLQDGAAGNEAGGLSGRPLFERSTIVLARMRRLIGKDMPLIGVGGVDSAETALAKIKAGADLVQLYTGFIFHGPSLVNDINARLLDIMERDGVKTITAYRDSETEAWADRLLAD